MCKLYYFIQAMSYTASILILTAISIERYFAITHPLKTKQFTTMFRLAVVMVIIWIMAALYAGPMLAIYDLVSIPGTNEEYCLLHDIDGVYLNMKAYDTSSFVLCYVVPLIIISILYFRISVVLWRSSSIHTIDKQKVNNVEHSRWNVRMSTWCSKRPGVVRDETATEMNHIENSNSQNILLANHNDISSHGHTITPQAIKSCGIGNNIVINCTKRRPVSPKNDASSSRRPAIRTKKKRKTDSVLMGRRRVIRLLLTVMFSFAVCVLPYHVRVLRHYWHPQEQEFSFKEKLFIPLSFIFYYLNSALNPVLYAFLSAYFRRSLRELWTCDRSTNMTMPMRPAYFHNNDAQTASCKTTRSTV